MEKVMPAAARQRLGRPEETRILGLTWPIFIELLLQMLVGNADQIMVGWYDPNAVGAIGNANQVTSLLLIVFSVLCTAAAILISQYIGAQDTGRVRQTCAAALLANALFGLAVGVVLVLFCGPIFTLMGVPEEIFGDTCRYTRIIGAGLVFQAVFLTYTAFFRSYQMMRQSMLISVCMNLLNIAGNAVLINGAFGLPALGAAGAAVSSSLSRIAGVLAISALFRRRFGPLFTGESLRPFPWGQLRRLLQIGVPAGGESVSYNLSQLCIQAACNRFALFVINTRVYANMFANLSYMFASAVCQAAQVVVARLMGSENLAQTNRQVKRTLLAAVAVSALVSSLLAVFCRPLLSLFTKDPQTLELFQLIMLIEIPLELGRAVNLVISRSLQACGDIRFPVAICIISAWITAAGGGAVLAVVFGLGLPGLWTAMACDECLRALLFLWRWRSGAWKRRPLLASL